VHEEREHKSINVLDKANSRIFSLEGNTIDLREAVGMNSLDQSLERYATTQNDQFYYDGMRRELEIHDLSGNEIFDTVLKERLEKQKEYYTKKEHDEIIVITNDIEDSL
jgi:hypothetical protein